MFKQLIVNKQLMIKTMKQTNRRMSLPVLSAQLITAPTGRPSEMRNLAPAEPPRPIRNKQMKE
jgi:hypothetical protein